MTLFKSYTFTWWQLGIFKLALLAFGVAAGAYWHEFFAAYLGALLFVAIAAALYTWYIALSQ